MKSIYQIKKEISIKSNIFNLLLFIAKKIPIGILSKLADIVNKRVDIKLTLLLLSFYYIK